MFTLSLPKKLYPWAWALAIFSLALIIYLVQPIGFKPGAHPPSIFCEKDLGDELIRGGHSEEVLWRGCLIASDTKKAFARFVPPDTKQLPCLGCHDGVKASTFASIWAKFPQVNPNTGIPEDLATAIRREVVLRYGGVMPNRSDNAVTALYFYFAAKAKQANLIFKVDSDTPKTSVSRESAEARCQTKFDAKGWPTGPAATHVVMGCNLMVNPMKYVRGPISQMTKTQMTCESCHREQGDLANAASIGHGAVVLPHMMTSMSQPIRFDRRILMCFARSLGSFDLGLDATEILDINFYANWLAQKAQLPIGQIPPGRGIPLLYDTLGKGQSFLAGEQVYREYCESCHGFAGNGGGILVDGREPPPIAGPNSFTRAASTSEPFRMAGFIYANMPLGATLENPILTQQQALDVAAYLSQLGRPSDFTKASPLGVLGNWLWVSGVTKTAHWLHQTNPDKDTH